MLDISVQYNSFQHIRRTKFGTHATFLVIIKYGLQFRTSV